MAAYVGKYDRTSADKYDEFLSELGVNMLMRKAATASTPVFEVNTNCYFCKMATWKTNYFKYYVNQGVIP